MRRLGSTSRAWVATTVVLFLAGLLAPSALTGARSAASPADDWSQFQYDSQHSGFNATESQLSRSNVASVAQQWAGTVEHDQIPGPPTVANGMVYVATLNDAVLGFP